MSVKDLNNCWTALKDAEYRRVLEDLPWSNDVMGGGCDFKFKKQ